MECVLLSLCSQFSVVSLLLTLKCFNIEYLLSTLSISLIFSISLNVSVNVCLTVSLNLPQVLSSFSLSLFSQSFLSSLSVSLVIPSLSCLVSVLSIYIYIYHIRIPRILTQSLHVHLFLFISFLQSFSLCFC